MPDEGQRDDSVRRCRAGQPDNDHYLEFLEMYKLRNARDILVSTTLKQEMR